MILKQTKNCMVEKTTIKYQNYKMKKKPYLDRNNISSVSSIACRSQWRMELQRVAFTNLQHRLCFWTNDLDCWIG